MDREVHLAKAAEYRRRAEEQPDDYLSALFRIVALDHERAAQVAGRSDYSKAEALNR